MKQIHIRFYEELNDFLPSRQRKKWLIYEFILKDTIRNVIESFGIPHTEVDLVLVNSESVGFEHAISDGDRISVYPVFESIDVSKTTQLRHEALRETRFILDVHLGKLTSYLRMLGFDSLYSNHFEDDEIIRIAKKEGRIVLTRDRGILKHKTITHGYYLHSDKPEIQLEEVLRRFDLISLVNPLSRCIKCNGMLEKVSKEEVSGQLEENTRKHYHDFYQCSNCKQVYWQGGHYENIVDWIDQLKDKFEKNKH